MEGQGGAGGDTETDRGETAGPLSIHCTVILWVLMTSIIPVCEENSVVFGIQLCLCGWACAGSRGWPIGWMMMKAPCRGGVTALCMGGTSLDGWVGGRGSLGGGGGLGMRASDCRWWPLLPFGGWQASLGKPPPTHPPTHPKCQRKIGSGVDGMGTCGGVRDTLRRWRGMGAKVTPSPPQGGVLK